MRPTLLAACALFLAACGGEVFAPHPYAPPPDPVAPGNLIVDWTVDGRKDPAMCHLAGAGSIEIQIDPADGSPGQVFAQSCQAFSAMIALYPGTYYATALLVDAWGRARTTTVDLDLLRMYGNDELVVPIDFPASSFY